MAGEGREMTYQNEWKTRPIGFMELQKIRVIVLGRMLACMLIGHVLEYPEPKRQCCLRCQRWVGEVGK